jgi:UDP-N-acetylglucosamine 1-carboxyvinyltransferase
MFVENVFESRYGHVDALRRMGARIHTSGRVAVVTGAGSLRGAKVTAPDLRGGAALVVAGLAARGETRVSGLSHIRRGYDDLEGELSRLGADIRRLP